MAIIGLPSLPFGINVFVPVPRIVSDIISFLTGFSGSQWGIFQDGQQVLTADSVNALGYKQEWSISNYPVEEGAFESYDKVSTPFDVRVRLVSGGSEENRQALLDDIAALAGNLELYDVVTPEAVYESCNIAGYDYRRTSESGAGMIILDVRLQEIRETATAEFSNTQSASAKSQVNGGTVQGVPTTTSQQNALRRVEITGGTFVDN